MCQALFQELSLYRHIKSSYYTWDIIIIHFTE